MAPDRFSSAAHGKIRRSRNFSCFTESLPSPVPVRNIAAMNGSGDHAKLRYTHPRYADYTWFNAADLADACATALLDAWKIVR